MPVLNRRPDPGRRAKLRLREDRFNLMTRVIGLEREKHRAELVGVDVRTLLRARKGIIGEVFVAGVIAGLRQHSQTLAQYGLEPTLDDLFEVVVDPGRRAA